MRKGIVLAGGSGTRLYPMTLSVNKQLLPVYDKPMVYYPISILMQAGIRDILVITTPNDAPAFHNLLGNGSQWGVNLQFAEQPEPRGISEAFLIGADFLQGGPACLVLGDNILYGQGVELQLQIANNQSKGATVFGYWVKNPERYGVAEIDPNGQVISIEEKPLYPKSNYAVIGLYFYDEQVVELARKLKRSARGELEITDLNRLYLQQGELHMQKLGCGVAWLDTGTCESLMQAGNFVETIESRQGLKIGCLEEIAYNRDWIDRDILQQQISKLGKSAYGVYIAELLRRQ